MTPQEISLYERNKRPPSPDQLDHIVAVLHARLPLTDAERRVLVPTPAVDAALKRQNGNGVVPVNRREFGQLAAAGGGTLVLAGVPIDLGELSLHQATQELIGRWATASPAESLEAARDLLNRQYRALKTAALAPLERRELLIDAVDTANLAGCSARFCDRPADAAACYALAQKFAQETDLDEVRGEVLASKAMLHRRLPGDGDARVGLQLARAAAPLVGSRGPMAKFTVNLQAEMLADLCQADLCQKEDSLRMLDAALSMPEDGGRDGFYSRRGLFCDWASEQGQWAGGRYAQLGRPDEALDHLQQAMAADSLAVSDRSAALTYRNVAHAYAVAGEPEPMCHYAQLALDGSLKWGVASCVPRIRSAREQLPHGCESLECVRELDERLATL